MNTKEMIEVYVRIENGKTLCICKTSNKKCGRNCEKDVVEMDPYRGWMDVFRIDRYGRSR